MIDKIRNAQNVENIVSDASKSEVVNFIVELQEERDTLRAELDSITDQLRAAKVEVAEEKRMKDSWFSHYENCYGNYHDALTQNMALRAELDKLKEQKPVGIVEIADFQTMDALADPEKPYRMAVNETSERSIQSLAKGTKLYAHPVPPQQVPEGWKLVPTIADSKMLDAGVAMALQTTIHGYGGWSNYISALYSQLLSAAPTPPSDEV